MTPDASPEQAPNPYTAPIALENRAEPMVAPTSAVQTVSERSIEAFRGTRGWVLLAGWSVLPVGLLMGLSALGDLPKLIASDPRKAGEAFGGLMFSAIFAISVFTSGILLIQYGAQIKRLTDSRRLDDLERAIETQRAYWRFVGGCIAVFFLLLFLLLPVAGFMFVVVGGKT